MSHGMERLLPFELRDKILKPMAVLVYVLFLLCWCGSANAVLSTGYYDQQCPGVEALIRARVQEYYNNDTRVGPGLLRLHFHDCMVRGCDASILLEPPEGVQGELASDLNAGMRFLDVIYDIKALVERLCPGVVTCADILAFAARDSVNLAGGPVWEAESGRLDGFVTLKADADAALPAPNMTLRELEAKFSEIGISLEQMVTLSGAHTVGQARCSTFLDRLEPRIAPDLDIGYGISLQRQCRSDNLTGDLHHETRVFLDVATPTLFDDQYFSNLARRRGLLDSDQLLFEENSTTALVRRYMRNRPLFFANFAQAILSLGRVGVRLQGDSQAEIRLDCRRTNPTAFGNSTRSGNDTHDSTPSVNNIPRGNNTAPGNYITPGNYTTPGNNTAAGNHTAPGNYTTTPGNNTDAGNHTAPGNHLAPGYHLAPGNNTASGNHPTPGNNSASGNNTAAGNHTAPGFHTAPGNHLAPGNHTGPGNYRTPGNSSTAPGNNSASGNNTAPGNYIIPGNYTTPGNNTAAGNHTAPGFHTSPGNHLAPGNHTGPGNYPTRGNSTAPGNNTAPSNNTTSGNNTASGDVIAYHILTM